MDLSTLLSVGKGDYVLNLFKNILYEFTYTKGM